MRTSKNHNFTSVKQIPSKSKYVRDEYWSSLLLKIEPQYVHTKGTHYKNLICGKFFTFVLCNILLFVPYVCICLLYPLFTTQAQTSLSYLRNTSISDELHKNWWNGGIKREPLGHFCVWFSKKMLTIFKEKSVLGDDEKKHKTFIPISDFHLWVKIWYLNKSQKNF